MFSARDFDSPAQPKAAAAQLRPATASGESHKVFEISAASRSALKASYDKLREKCLQQRMGAAIESISVRKMEDGSKMYCALVLLAPLPYIESSRCRILQAKIRRYFLQRRFLLCRSSVITLQATVRRFCWKRTRRKKTLIISPKRGLCGVNVKLRADTVEALLEKVAHLKSKADAKGAIVLVCLFCCLFCIEVLTAAGIRKNEKRERCSGGTVHTGPFSEIACSKFEGFF